MPPSRSRFKRKDAATAALVVAAAGLGYAIAGFVFAGPDKLAETNPVASMRALVGADVGRDATSPQAIPARGWLAILKRTIMLAVENRLMQEAAGVTFFALLAIFPALTATVSLYGLFADPENIARLLDAVAAIVPGGGLDLMRGQLHALVAKGSRGLTIGAAIGLGITLWSANQGSKALFDALNVVYREEEKRSYPTFVMVAMAFTLGAIVFVILAMIGVVLLPDLVAVLGIGAAGRIVLDWARWPSILVVVGLFLASLYRFGPSRENPKWRWVTWGGFGAAISWVGVSFAFSWYVQHFGSFDRTYGSLGAVAGFMTWIWLSTFVVLCGAQLNSEMEHQTAVDTTTGDALPLGGRGATQADTVA